MSDGSDVFKLVGPVLLKQDKSEAMMTVNQRLDFIENEMYASFSIVTEDLNSQIAVSALRSRLQKPTIKRRR